MMKDTYYLLTGASAGAQPEETGEDFRDYTKEPEKKKESITLIIIGNDEGNIDMAIKKIEKFIEEEFLQVTN